MYNAGGRLSVYSGGAVPYDATPYIEFDNYLLKEKNLDMPLNFKFSSRILLRIVNHCVSNSY